MSRDRARVLELLRGAHRLLVVGHVRPDGDTSSSALALGRAMDGLGRETCVCLVDGMPDRVAFLPDAERVVRDPRPLAPFDLVVVVDCAAYARIGLPLREDPLAPVLVNIDHHRTNERYGDVDWVDDRYPATAMMIHELIQELGAPMDPDLATQLFTGIATDTGYLRYEATTPETMRVMASLMEQGADHATLYRQLFEETTLGQQRLVGRALERLNLSPDGALVWTTLTHLDGAELEVEGALASMGVGPLCRIRGVELAACFEERAGGDVVVEFRSRGAISVDGLARSLGGGGHAKASGCTVPGPLDEVLPRVLALLERALDEHRSPVRRARGQAA